MEGTSTEHGHHRVIAERETDEPRPMKTKHTEAQTASPGTPVRPAYHAEPRMTGRTHLENGGSQLRALAHSMNAPGIQTFGHKYMPFAAGFSHTPDEAAVYRSSRLHAINPTAAVTDDVSYYYTLDNGKHTPAADAANPEAEGEFIRNTRRETHGGMFGALMKPIK